MSPRTKLLYFIGVGGIGMSGLARYFRRQGKEVAGYDRTPSELTGELMREGIDVHYAEDPAHIPEHFRTADIEDILVVRTPAVSVQSPLMRYWMERGARILKRSELLGQVTRDRRTVGVAGTHGKTTVSTMLAHFLREGGVRCNAFLGGIAANYGTNVLLDDGAVVNVVEADEFDRSFLQLLPTEAIITAMDPDHLDVYGSAEAMYDAYDTFAGLCSGRLLVHDNIERFFTGRSNVTTYSLASTGDPRAENLRVENGMYHFDLVSDEKRIKDLQLGMPGRHNVENAIAASAMALHLGVTEAGLRRGLASFRGVARRFQMLVRGPKAFYIDDYAHHPVELDACIGSARELFPNKRITGIFQPHLFSRTRDMADGFVQSLGRLDELILLDIYPAREEAIPGITSSWLLDQVPCGNKRLATKEELRGIVEQVRPEVLLTMGAGDIDRMVPALTGAMENLNMS